MKKLIAITLLLTALRAPAPEPKLPHLWLQPAYGHASGGGLWVHNTSQHQVWFTLEFNAGSGWFTASDLVPVEPGVPQFVSAGFEGAAPACWQVRAKEAESNQP